jgi:hypothetical protein
MSDALGNYLLNSPFCFNFQVFPHTRLSPYSSGPEPHLNYVTKTFSPLTAIQTCDNYSIGLLLIIKQKLYIGSICAFVCLCNAIIGARSTFAPPRNMIVKEYHMILLSAISGSNPRRGGPRTKWSFAYRNVAVAEPGGR